MIWDRVKRFGESLEGAGSNIGTLDKGLDEGSKMGWTVVSMKNDWKVIYPE